MIELKAGLKFFILAIVLMTSFSQLSVAGNFDSPAQNSVIDSPNYLHPAHDVLDHQKLVSNDMAPITNHCAGDELLLHCGGCMLCAVLSDGFSQGINASDIFISYGNDVFFSTYIEKELRPPRF
jgi:hypothetical protein